MPETNDRYPASSRLAFCVLFHLVCGALLAVGYHLTFQITTEDARVMAGLVEYPRNNIYFLIHTNSWSLMNQLGAFALKCGATEEALSIALCALGGAFSCTALGLIALSWSNSILCALLVPLGMYAFGLGGFPSANYPIILMGSMYTQGIIGLFFGLLTVGFAGCGRTKTAAFLAGISVCIHPTLGVFYLFSFTLFVLFVRKTMQPAEIKGIILMAAAGMFLSLASLALQKLYFAAQLPPTDRETVALLLHKCLQNFSWHRNPESKVWFSRATGVAMIPAALAVIYLRRKPVADRRGYAAAAMCALAVTALCSVATDSIITSDYFDLVMAWRYFNVLNVCCIPVAIGILGYTGHSREWQSLALLSGLVVYAAATQDQETAVIYILSGLAAGWVACAGESTASAAVQRSRNILAGALLTVAAVVIIMPAVRNVATHNIDPAIFMNYKHSAEYGFLSKRPGLLLISSASGLLHTRIKRPILIGPNDLEAHLYLPETLPEFNRILNEIYGLDLMTAQPNSPVHSTWLTREHRTLWESRSSAAWHAIREKFGTTDIATPPDWDLDLHLVMATDQFNLYEIP